MSRTMIAERYARALFESAAAHGRDEDGVLVELQSWAAFLAGGSDAARVLLSPVVDHRRQLQVLQALAQQNDTRPVVKQFLKLCLHKKRLGLLGDMAQAYARLLDARAGVARGTVTSAHALPPPLREQLTGKLAALLAGKPVLQFEEDPALLGGFAVRVGHRVWNATLKAQLDRLGDNIRKGVR